MASFGEGCSREWYRSDGESSEVTRAEPSAPGEATTGKDQQSSPFMVDIMSGPNYPFAKAFEMAGWHILAVDLLFGEGHDLSKLNNQEKIKGHLKLADFIGRR